MPAGGSASLGSLVRWRNRSTQFGLERWRLKSVDVSLARKTWKKLLRREDEWGVVVGYILFASLKPTLDTDETK